MCVIFAIVLIVEWLAVVLNAPVASSVVFAAPVLALFVVLTLASWHWALARWQIDRPRGIVVPDLHNGSGESLPVDHLTALFRERLTRVGLTPPGPTPAAAPPSEALTLIRAAGRERAPLAAVAGLMEGATPRFGYQVLGTLVRREKPPCRGVVTQVIDADGHGSQPAARWADTWDEAVEQGAYEAAAYVLPRVRARDTVRWVGWYGIDMPAALLNHFVRAERLVAERRYDEALDHYFRALEHDPQSLDLRLEIGSVQEQLNLWLDALVTYTAAIDLAEKRSGAIGVRRSPERRAEQKARKRATYLLRYRRAVLLGFGEHLADEWMRTGTTRRDSERAALRMCLRPWLKRQLADPATEKQPDKQPAERPDKQPAEPPDRQPAERAREPGAGEHPKAASTKIGTAGCDGARKPLLMWVRRRLWRQSAASAAAEQRSEQPAKQSAEATAQAATAELLSVILDAARGEAALGEGTIDHEQANLSLRWLLQFASENAFRDLVSDHRKIAAARTQLTRESLRVAEFWAVVHRVTTEVAGAERMGWTAPTADWLTSPEALGDELDERMRMGLRSLALRSRRVVDWTSSYNAACTCAIAYSACKGRSQEMHDHLPDAAVDHLETAVRSADPALLRQNRSWLLTGDPDLAELRTTDRFKRFEAEYLPTSAPPARRPRAVHRYQLASHLRALIASSAQTLEDQWHDRTARAIDHNNPHELLTWCTQEQEAWKRVEAVARDRHLWQSRAALVRAMGGWCPNRPVGVPHADYAENPLSDGVDIDKRADDAIEASDQWLDRLGAEVAAIDCETHNWITVLKKAHAAGEPISAEMVAALGTTHAALWSGLASWMTAPICLPMEDADRDFQAAIERLSAPALTA